MELFEIRTAMKASGISYGRLAQQTGIPKSALQRYATGTTEKIPIDRLKAIAFALNIDLTSLVGSGCTLQNPYSEIEKMLDQLNQTGIQKVKERIEELLEIPRYSL